MIEKIVVDSRRFGGIFIKKMPMLWQCGTILLFSLAVYIVSSEACVSLILSDVDQVTT